MDDPLLSTKICKLNSVRGLPTYNSVESFGPELLMVGPSCHGQHSTGAPSVLKTDARSDKERKPLGIIPGTFHQ